VHIFGDYDFTMMMLNAAVCLSVLYNIYLELTAVFTFAARTSDKSDFLVAQIQRPSALVYYAFLLMTAVIICVMIIVGNTEKIFFMSLVALLIGFLVNALVYQVCFVNDGGLGSVSPKLEMEIPWNAIQSYQWKENTLRLTLRRRFFRHIKLKFYDSAAIVAVNDRLNRFTDKA
jgi:hypothetical protein